MYEETNKPEQLSDATVPLYYMYGNGLDYKDGKPHYKEITTDEELQIAYKVYEKLNLNPMELTIAIYNLDCNLGKSNIEMDRLYYKFFNEWKDKYSVDLDGKCFKILRKPYDGVVVLTRGIRRG